MVDALDSAEFSGSLIILLNEGVSFAKRNMKTRWKKTADSRVEMPDYCERSVFEALVNALIHRDYLILGSEVHIDIYDDRLTIYSPGGMADGTRIQEPKFYSDASSFQVTLYNLNYGTAANTTKVTIEGENVAIEVAIDRLNASQGTIEKVKAVFANVGVDGVFGRSDIATITKDSVTAAGNLITKLKNADLIEPVSGFGRFGHIFLPCHIGNNDCHALVAGSVNLGKVPMQRSVCEQGCIEDRTMLFQIAVAHTPILADLVFRFVRQREIGNKIISLLTVSATHFLK